MAEFENIRVEVYLTEGEGTKPVPRRIEPLELSVERAIDNAVASFSMKCKPSDRKKVRPGTRVDIHAGGQPVIYGRVDALSFEQGKGEISVSVGGRDLAADLVDCSIITEETEWWDVNVLEIAELAAKPYGVRVLLGDERSDLGALFSPFKITAGEKVWEAIERACRLRGLLCYTHPDGTLLVGPPAAGESTKYAQTQLLNPNTSSFELNDSDRFSIIRVRSQTGSDDDNWGEAAVLIEANAIDTGIRRHRELIILAEAAATAEDAEVRAQWEATVRAARSERLSINVNGWMRTSIDAQGNEVGKLWAINELVHIDGIFGIKADLLVSAVSFKRTKKDGATTDLELVRKDSFTAQPVVEEKDDPWGQAFEGGEE